jgi:DNA-binding NarL/FixJ family response regulator
MRVIVIDDSIIVREGLRRLLESERHQVVDMVSRPERVVGAIATGQPDAVILDIRMPPTFTDEGVQIAMSLRKTMPKLAILVLSQYAIPEYATRLLETGATGTGYLLKDRVLEPLQLSQALQRLSEGGTVIDPDVVGELLTAKRSNDPLNALSERERAVLRLMAEGLSDKGIAERLFVSLNTVGTHVRNIFQKLNLPRSAEDNRRVLAVLLALQH